MPKNSLSKGALAILTENTLNLMGYQDGKVYRVLDVLDEEKFNCPIVLGCDENGEDWKEFFKRDEIILL